VCNVTHTVAGNNPAWDGYVRSVTFDPRPRYRIAGALFLVAAVIVLLAGASFVALVLALVAAGLFYYSSRVKTVP
jgi:hypothetical protein